MEDFETESHFGSETLVEMIAVEKLCIFEGPFDGVTVAELAVSVPEKAHFILGLLASQHVSPNSLSLPLLATPTFDLHHSLLQ